MSGVADRSGLDARLTDVAHQYDEVQAQLVRPETSTDPDAIRRLGKELSRLEPVVAAFRRLEATRAELAGARELRDGAEADDELKSMAADEVARLESDEAGLVDDLKVLLLPRDPNDDRDVIMEIRAGAGGDEAALFAGDLFRMYQRYAASRGWKVEIESLSGGDAGGYKEIIANITGKGVFARLKFESGVHRVQRVPETEAQGRIHTSAATVAVLPEAEEVDIKIDDKDLRIDVFRASGPGGQSVNTTDSAVRITHLPSGLVVSQQDEKSQHKNKAKGMKVLRARLYDLERAKLDAERAQDRRSQIGSGDRSERIRTYNFPQGRVTDHRIGFTTHQLYLVLEGEPALDELINALITEHQTNQLSAMQEPVHG